MAKKIFKKKDHDDVAPVVAKKRAVRQDPTTRLEKRENTNYVQDFIPISRIENGIIETTDKRFVKIIEITPNNFDLKSVSEKENIILTFASWMKTIGVKAQFKVISRKADSKNLIDRMNADLAIEKNKKTVDAAKHYLSLIRNIAGTESIARRFFIILEYERDPDIDKGKTDYLNIVASLNHAEQSLAEYLRKCGNSIIHHENESYAVAEILYELLNKKSSKTEPLSERIKRVDRDTMKEKGRIEGVDELPYINPVQYISPRGIDPTHPTHIVIDGVYHSFMYIHRDGYPSHVWASWGSMFSSFGDGVDVDIFFEKIDRHEAKRRVITSIKINRTKLFESKDTDSDYESVIGATRSAMEIKQALSSNQDLYWMSVLLTITASTYEDLLVKRKMITKALRGEDFKPIPARFKQKEALISSLPILSLDKSIEKRAQRNVLTNSAAAIYPFTSFELSDEDGIVMGVNKSNSSLCVVDLFNTKKYKNANMTIIGTTGAGKTFASGLLCGRARMKGIQTFVIAPLKGFEFKKHCEGIGGEYVKISPASGKCINIMEIRIPEVSEESLLVDDDSRFSDSLLLKKMQNLNIFFSMIFPENTAIENQILEEAIIKTYAQKDITTENESLWDENGNIREMPTLGDLYNNLVRDPRAQKMVIFLSKYVTGAARVFNGQTNIPLDNKYIVFDVSELTEDFIEIGMFLALDIVWDKIKEDRTKRKIIFIDEVWRVVGQGASPRVANFVLEIYKIIRGYGGGAISATQNISDFFALEDGKYGKGIINNSAAKLMLMLEKDEAKELAEIVGLTPQEFFEVTTFAKGEGLLKVGEVKSQIVIKPSDKEVELLTTDINVLNALAESKKQEKIIEEKMKAEGLL